MITLLVIIFIISMVVMKIKDSPEQEREHVERYLGEDFADKEYYRKKAKQQIKEEDRQEIKEHPGNLFIAGKQGWTLLDRIKERAEKLQREAVEEDKNNK